MASHRPDRVGEQIRDELSSLLSRGAVHDPGIGFITLTRVKVSPDLQQARVFYTSLGDEKARRETAKALARATPFLRRQIGGILSLRRVPELEFRFDESIGHQDRIEQILRDLHAEEAERAAAADPADTATSPDAIPASAPVDTPDDPDDK
jgi:ribosome-binding factor A